ncbi:hypothetical protein WA016_04680 [Myxococcus stipitatus]
MAKALGAQQSVPFELLPDTILDTSASGKYAPGITPFTADVTPSGSASVALPLWVPPGRAGIQPSLAITYDSTGTDGLLGPGFNLAGLSQITLCPNSFARDGKLNALSFAHHPGPFTKDIYSRVYCLDGMRLVGSGARSFKTEQDTYASIRIPENTWLSNPETFEVRGRDGLIRTYGKVATGPTTSRSDALIEGEHEQFDRGPDGNVRGSGPMTVKIAWALASVEDRFGNRMDIFYQQAPLGAVSGAWHRPSRIVYTQFRDASGSIEPGQREVAFDYEARPDVFKGYLAGVKVGRDFRLSGITMRGPGLAPGASTLSQVPLRSYKLEYSKGAISNRSLLTKVYECDGRGVCKSPVYFEWEHGSWDFHFPPAQDVSDAAAGAGLNAFGLGAGRQGLAYFVKSEMTDESALYLAGSDGTKQTWKDTMRLLQFPDAESSTPVKSDETGLAGWDPYFNVEGTTFLDDVWDAIFGGSDPGDFCKKRPTRGLYPMVADWEGLGRSKVTPLSCKWWPFELSKFPGVLSPAPAYGYVSTQTSQMLFTGSEPNSQFWLDIDGDRRNELIWMGQHEIDLTGDADRIIPAKRRVFTKQTSKRREVKISDPGYFQQSPLGVRAVDLDGSGKMSILGVGPSGNRFLDALSYMDEPTGAPGNTAALNPVATTVRPLPELPSGTILLFRTFHFVDVNGDGLQDAVALGQMGQPEEYLKLRVQFNTGAGFTEIRETSITDASIATGLYGAKTEHGDFDGDGRVDFAVFKPGSPVLLLLAGPQGDFAQHQNLWLVRSGENKEWSQVIDANNDGQLDFTYRQGNALQVALRTHAVDVLKRVHGNIQSDSYMGSTGLRYSFEYAPLSQGNAHGEVTPSERFYSRGQEDDEKRPELRLTPETRRVVSRMSLNVDGQRVRSWRYLYRDGVSDTRGLGWLGFGQRIVVDETTGARTTTNYHNRDTETGPDGRVSATLAHHPREEVTELPVDSSTTLQTRRTWTYARTPQVYASSYQQYARRVVETVHELKGNAATVVSETETLTQLDAYGTPIQSTTLVHSADKTEQVKTQTSVGGFDTNTWLPTGTWSVTTSWMSCTKSPETGCVGQADASNTRTQQVTFGERGQISSAETEPARAGETVTPHTSETYLKTLFTRDTRGLVVQVSQQGSGVVRSESVTYDGVDQTQVASTTDAEGATWRYLFHPGLGVVAQTADPNGVHMRLQYDGFGRQRVATPLYLGPSTPPGNQSIVRTYYEWNGSQPRHRTQVATGPWAVAETLTEFDSMGRPFANQWKRFDGADVVSSVTYDALGRVVRKEAPRTSSEQPTWEGYEYDALNRVKTRRFGDGATGPGGNVLETFSYTVTAPYSLQASVTDVVGTVKKTLHDFQGRVVRATEAAGTSNEATMAYSYGPFGRLEFTEDPQGNRSVNFYDAVGRLERTVDPSSGTGTFLYNAFGEVKSHSDGAASQPGRVTTTYQRDLLGRVLSATSEREQLEYVYDLGPGGMRRLSRETRTPTGNPQGVVITDHIHDVHGRETDTSLRVGGDTLVMSRQYDEYGQVKRLTYPAMRNGQPMSIGYSYDSRGGIATVHATDSITNYWRVVERDSADRVKKAWYGNGIEREFRYDTKGRLRFLTARHQSTQVQRLAYEYAVDDNLSARHDLVLGITEKYGYDALDRLERWKVQQNCQTLDVRFQYDKLGNLLSRSPVTGWEPSATLNYGQGATGGPHAVKQAQLGADSFTYEYDHRGNQTASRDGVGNLVRSTQYTSFDLPESIITGDRTVFFDYDASGTRVRKRTQDGQEETVYVSGLYQRHKQGLATTHIISIPSPEGVIAELSWDEGSNTESTRYFLNDRQGSPDTITSSTGAVLERIKYEPFGGRRDANNMLQASTATHSGGRRGFTGHEQDDEFGLINMRGRIYDPRLMRFLSVDPVIADGGSTQAHNAYAYVLNNPTRYTDPSGFTPHGGTLVSRWDGGWTGSSTPMQSTASSLMDRYASAPGASPFLVTVDFRVPSVASLDNAKMQPDAHHTNDIGQSSAPSVSTSAPQLLATTVNAAGVILALSLGTAFGNAEQLWDSPPVRAIHESFDNYLDAAGPQVTWPPNESAITDTDGAINWANIHSGLYEMGSIFNRALAVQALFGGQGPHHPSHVRFLYSTPKPSTSPVSNSPTTEIHSPSNNSTNSVRNLHAEATAARDEFAAQAAQQKHAPATVVGAYSPSTGRVTAQSSLGQGRGCAEGVCAEALGNPSDIQFTRAIRPRHLGRTVDVCPKCEGKYGRHAFPDPTTQFASDKFVGPPKPP